MLLFLGATLSSHGIEAAESSDVKACVQPPRQMNPDAAEMVALKGRYGLAQVTQITYPAEGHVRYELQFTEVLGNHRREKPPDEQSRLIIETAIPRSVSDVEAEASRSPYSSILR